MSPRFSSKDGLGREGGQQISFNRDKDGLIGYPERMFVLTMSRILTNFRILTILTTFRILITFRILTRSFSVVLNCWQIEVLSNNFSTILNSG